MKTITRRLGVAAVSAGALVLTLAPGAHAARGVQTDPTGDVQGYHQIDDGSTCPHYEAADPTGVPNVDLTGLAVLHNKQDVRIVVRYADLGPGDLHLVVPVLTPSRDFGLILDRFPADEQTFTFASQYRETLQHASRYADDCGAFSFGYKLGNCSHLRTSVAGAKDTVTFTVPRTCFGNPKWVRVGAEAYVARDQYESAESDFADRVDKTPPTAYLPTYGPRVFEAKRSA